MAKNLGKLVKTWKLGKVDYGKGLKLQEQLSTLHNHSENTAQNTLLCLEHFPVYTIGIRTKEYSEEEERKLKQTGADFYKTNRGGLITFHGPGQLVVYPILNLKHFKPSIRWYVSQIEAVVIDLCAKYGLNCHTSPDTGVWIGKNKICAIGIHGSRFITTHGLALNCNTDLSWFKHIVPCGLVGKGVTSLSKELGRDVAVEEVMPHFVDSFCKVFECEAVDISEIDAQKLLNGLKEVE